MVWQVLKIDKQTPGNLSIMDTNYSIIIIIIIIVTILRAEK